MTPMVLDKYRQNSAPCVLSARTQGAFTYKVARRALISAHYDIHLLRTRQLHSFFGDLFRQKTARTFPKKAR